MLLQTVFDLDLEGISEIAVTGYLSPTPRTVTTMSWQHSHEDSPAHDEFSTDPTAHRRRSYVQCDPYSSTSDLSDALPQSPDSMHHPSFDDSCRITSRTKHDNDLFYQSVCTIFFIQVMLES
jgi:hypothetical protein